MRPRSAIRAPVKLTNPPLNLFSGEVIEDLRASVDQVKQTPLRALLVRAEGNIFSGGVDVNIFQGRTPSEARARFTSHLELIADLEKAGFIKRGGKGSHRNFTNPDCPMPVTISGRTASDPSWAE